MVTEFCEGGSLVDWLQENPKIGHSDRLSLIKGIASGKALRIYVHIPKGVNHLHMEHIIHRDLGEKI